MISCFHTFVIVFIVKTAQGATKMFSKDVYEGHEVPALTRRRTGLSASDQCLDSLSLYKAIVDNVTYN